jgi:propanediol dehydratase small subunit
MTRKFSIADYPLAETQPENVIGPRGKALSDITLTAVTNGEVTMEDLRITPQALRAQAEISQAANRPTLAKNFNRAAELVNVPQDFIMATYELLRPGRAKSKRELMTAAHILRETYKAPAMAAFVEEAAEVYQQRGLFTFRY